MDETLLLISAQRRRIMNGKLPSDSEVGVELRSAPTKPTLDPLRGLRGQKLLIMRAALTLTEDCHGCKGNGSLGCEGVIGEMVACSVCHGTGKVSMEFTKEDLVVACHELDKEMFGLAGHLEHPDSHKVWSNLCGKKGLVAMGRLRTIEEQAGCGEVVHRLSVVREDE